MKNPIINSGNIDISSNMYNTNSYNILNVGDFYNSQTKPWGWHLILDASGCSQELISEPDNIKEFIETLVPAIDMIAYGEPLIERFGVGHLQGYSLVQLIHTSNICAHFAEDSRSIFLDVFSCKEFDVRIVEDVVRHFFNHTVSKKYFIERRPPTSN